MAQIIRPKTCKTCKYAEWLPDTSDFECRRFPPQGGPVVVPLKPGMMQVQMHMGWPRVTADGFCGEHAPKIEQAAAHALSSSLIMDQ